MSGPAFYSTGSWLPHAGQEEPFLVDEFAPTETQVVARVTAAA